MILSDRDLTNTWSGAADGTLEARLYHLQNWRNDLCAVADGDVIARHYRYSAYGSRTEIDAADYNRDGITDIFDVLDFNSDYSTSAARADFNNNGVVNSADSTDFVDSFNVTSDDSPHSAPRGLYAGYEHDPALEYQGALSGGGAAIYTIESYAHVRHRVYSTELGRWTRRDPLGYHDGMGLYEYVSAMPLPLHDPYGLYATHGGRSDCKGTSYELIAQETWSDLHTLIGAQALQFSEPQANSRAWDGCNDALFCYKMYANRSWQDFLKYKSCAADAGFEFSATLAKCLIACIPAIKFGPKGYGICMAVCTGVDSAINLWMWRKCWEVYDQNRTFNINTYCLCLNKRSNCPSPEQRKEDGYHGVNCAGTPIPRLPKTPEWP